MIEMCSHFFLPSSFLIIVSWELSDFNTLIMVAISHPQSIPRVRPWRNHLVRRPMLLKSSGSGQLYPCGRDMQDLFGEKRRSFILEGSVSPVILALGDQKANWGFLELICDWGGWIVCCVGGVGFGHGVRTGLLWRMIRDILLSWGWD